MNYTTCIRDAAYYTVPEEYFAPARHSGTVERVLYKTKAYDGTDSLQEKYAYVYLPCGYDSTKKYDILYLLHGGGDSPDAFLGGVFRDGSQHEYTGQFKRILDNLMEKGRLRPMIIVAPSYYPASHTDRSIVSAEECIDKFEMELSSDLIPAVEKIYGTYAVSTDPCGLEESRDHRALGGFSMGSLATWYGFMRNLKYFRTFIPVSGDCWVIEMRGGLTHPAETAAALLESLDKSGDGESDFDIYAITGTEDIAFPMMSGQMGAMRELGRGFVFGENTRFYVKEGGVHNYDNVFAYLWRLLPEIWGCGE